MDEPKITLTTFMRFLVATPAQRVRIVQEAKGTYSHVYGPPQDYWFGPRKAFSGARSGPELLNTLKQLADSAPTHKTANYRALCDGISRWLARKSYEPLTSRRVPWTEEGLTVRLNPELVGRIDGRLYAIKVWPRREVLGKVRLNGVLHLLEWGFAGNGYHVGVLLAQAGRLVEPTVTVAHIEDYLAGEAAMFVALWNRPPRRGHLRAI